MTNDERTPLLRENGALHFDGHESNVGSDGRNHQSENAPATQTPQDHGAAGDENPADLEKTKVVLILGAMWCGVFLGALDTTIVATLITSISSSFGASNQAGWLGTSYLLSVATFTPLYGRMCDIAGRRASNLLALGMFAIGTTLCATAQTMEWLIAARFIAGMGGGGIMTTSSIVASDLIPIRRRGFVQGLTNICFGAGAGLGGPLGGLMADTIGWRWAFAIQIPILFIAFILVAIFVHYRMPGQGKSRKEMVKRIDFLGSFTLIISVGSLLLALAFKNNQQMPWSSPYVWAFLIVFVVFLAAFIYVEARVSIEPLLPMRIVVGRNASCIAIVNFLTSMGAFSVLYFFPMYFEAVKLTSSSQAGLHLLLNSPALSAGSLFAGWIMRRTGRYYWLTTLSALLPILGTILMSILTTNIHPFFQWFDIVPTGFGFSVIITSTLIALISTVERKDMAVATGITYLFRYTGQVVGVALSSAVLQGVLASELRKRIHGPGSEEVIQQIRHTASIVRDLPPDIQKQAIESYTVGLRSVWILNASLAFLCFLVTLPIKEYQLASSFKEEDELRKKRALLEGSPTLEDAHEESQNHIPSSSS